MRAWRGAIVGRMSDSVTSTGPPKREREEGQEQEEEGRRICK